MLISKLKSTVRIKTKANIFSGKSLINKVLFNNHTFIYSIAPGANVRLTGWIYLDYSFSAEYINSYVENQQKSSVSVLKQNLSLFAFPAKGHMFSLNTEHYFLDETNSYFLDSEYRFKLPKRKIVIEILWNNMLNTKKYIYYRTFPSSVIKSIYVLRPSQVLVTVKFGFR